MLYKISSLCRTQVGGGGTPLFLASQNEYRPTAYMQSWAKMWFEPANRLMVYREFQEVRCQFVQDAWQRIPTLKDVNLTDILSNYRDKMAIAQDSQILMGHEANFAKSLYRALARALGNHGFERLPGSGETSDRFNRYLDHGNYLAYGLAATVLWVLGIPHSMPVAHGLTRRGALVFDVADVIKDAVILPNAFLCAAEGFSDQEMRNRCIAFMDETRALKLLFDTVKHITEQSW